MRETKGERKRRDKGERERERQRERREREREIKETWRMSERDKGREKETG